MYFKKTLVFSVAVCFLLLYGCGDDDESTCDIDPALIDCIGFPTLGFVITSNGENFFNNHSIESINIEGADAQNTEFFLRSGFDSVEGSVLFIRDSDWSSGDFEYLVALDTNNLFSINLSFELSEGPCCGGIPILNSISINNIPTERDNTNGFYLIDLN